MTARLTGTSSSSIDEPELPGVCGCWTTILNASDFGCLISRFSKSVAKHSSLLNPTYLHIE